MRHKTLVLLLLFSASCRQGSVHSTLSEDRFRSVYVALLLASESTKTFPGDTTRHFNADSIFRSFNTSAGEYRQTVDSYKADPKKWKAFYEVVIRSLEDSSKQKSARPG